MDWAVPTRERCWESPSSPWAPQPTKNTPQTWDLKIKDEGKPSSFILNPCQVKIRGAWGEWDAQGEGIVSHLSPSWQDIGISDRKLLKSSFFFFPFLMSQMWQVAAGCLKEYFWGRTKKNQGGFEQEQLSSCVSRPAASQRWPIVPLCQKFSD